jgi:hypothetical protein
MTHAFIGLMVLYRLTADDASATNMRRDDALRNRENSVSEGDRVPMIITRVWLAAADSPWGSVNGQAFLDGNDSLWVTSVEEGDQPGQWEAITDG